MKYKLTTSKRFYTAEEEVKILESLGFTFKDLKSYKNILKMMKTDDLVEIEINSIEDFNKLQKKINADLVIDFVEKRIEIYDGYRE